MTLEQFSQIFEIAGSVAVIGSLIFFGMEFRKNTKVQEAAAFQGSIANDMEILLRLGENTEIARLFFAYRDAPETLSEEEQFQGANLMAAVIRHMENLYFQYQRGMLSEQAWRSKKPLILSAINSPGFKMNTELHYAGFYDGEFMDFAIRQRNQ